MGVTNGLAATCTVRATNVVGDSGESGPSNSVAANAVWRAAGSMSVGRTEHSLTLLATGSVLVVGGYGSGGYLSSAERYDPSTNTWSATTPMNISRANHGANLLPNGNVLVTGGFNNGVPTNTTAIYNVSNGTWSAGPTMLVARANHNAITLGDGRIIVIGGTSIANVDTAEIYNPASNTWSMTSAMVASRGGRAQLLANGLVLVFGGVELNPDPESPPTRSRKAELYNADINTWTATGLMTSTRSDHFAALLPNNHVIVTGGEVSTPDIYNPFSGTWSSGPADFYPWRSMHSATRLSNGSVVLTGGLGNNGNTRMSTTTVYTNGFTVATSRSAGADLITARSGHRAVLLASGKVLVTGGQSGSAYLVSAEIRDAESAGLPGVPIIGLATAGANSISVTFTPPTSDGGSTIVSYTASCGSGAATGATSPILVTGLSNGTFYTCTVYATNAVGNGPVSAASNEALPALAQTINFGTNPGPLVFALNGTFNVSAIASSSLSVTFSTNTPTVCNVDTASGVVTMLTTGICTIAADQGGSTIYAPAPQVTQNITINPNSVMVTASAGANGSITPAGVLMVMSGTTANFTVQPDSGYSATVSGTCGGSLVGTTYTTAVVTASCTVVASFAPSIALIAVQSRKTHGSAGVFDLLMDTAPLVGGNVTVEPRVIGSGHTIVFQFNQAVTAIGTVIAVDANNNAIGTVSAVINGNNSTEVLVTLTGIADASRVAITLNGVNGSLTSSVALGFLVGDVNNSRSVGNTDLSAIKIRIGQTLDSTNFKYDVNVSGSVSNTDITAAKTRVGLGL
jgi:Kelch motif/Galactose oxidase, central domain/Fibronectin type III domain